MRAHDRGMTFTGDRTDPHARILHSDNQREGEEHRPKCGEPELGSGLRVRGSAGRIIICRACHKARAENLQKTVDWAIVPL